MNKKLMILPMILMVGLLAGCSDKAPVEETIITTQTNVEKEDMNMNDEMTPGNSDKGHGHAIGVPISSEISLNWIGDSNAIAGSLTKLSFQLSDKNDNAIKNFQVVHTKKMHLIVAKKDLSEFFHIHPELDESNGIFSFEINFPSNGTYEFFADQTVNSENTIVRSNINVGSDVSDKVLSATNPTQMIDGYEVTMKIEQHVHVAEHYTYTLAFKKDGKAVGTVSGLEDYLGEKGHSVGIKENSYEYLHAHPLANTSSSVTFQTELPSKGKYMFFTQVKIEGNIITVPYLVETSNDDHGEEVPHVDEPGAAPHGH